MSSPSPVTTDPAADPSGSVAPRTGRRAPAQADSGAAERLRLRYPAPRVPRRIVVVLVAVLAAVFVTWLIWAGLIFANPAVKGQILQYAVTTDTEVSFVLTVDRPDPSVPATCRVIAQAVNFERVGTLDIAVPRAEIRLLDITQTMKTFRRATSVSVDSCWTG